MKDLLLNSLMRNITRYCNYDEIKLKELELKVKEFELKEKLMMKQLEEGSGTSDVAQALRDIFGNEDNK